MNAIQYLVKFVSYKKIRFGPEPEFENVEGAKESIPPAYAAQRSGICRTGPPGYIQWASPIDSFESIPGLLKRLQIRALLSSCLLSWLIVRKRKMSQHSGYLDEMPGGGGGGGGVLWVIEQKKYNED